MYLKHFKLNKEPFNITPDPDFLFLTPAHKEALASIIYGVEQRKGFIAVIGEIGVGKTTILRSYLNQIDSEKLVAIYILNPMLSFSNLLRVIGRELGVPLSSLSTFEMVSQLQEHLVEEFKRGRNIALIIDEAQNMPVDTLENLRMLSNLETAKEKLIQIVFSGQPEFEKTLNLLELKQLKQRIAVKAVISPLDLATGVTYILSRLRKATSIESVPFTTGALKEIVRLAQGIPRVINILCDNCLISAYGYGVQVVTTRIVREVGRDNAIEGSFFYRWQAPICAGSAIFVIASLAGVMLISPVPQQKAQVSLPVQAQPEEERLPPDREQDAGRRYQDRVVQRGDTLAKLVLEVYGRADKRRMRLVREANPDISDENLIVEGGRIRFPLEDKETGPGSAR